MKTKLTETKWKSAIGGIDHLLRIVASFGAIVLICASASSQNLFVSANDSGGGKILKFTWDGVRSTFTSGLSGPQGVAFDSAGNLFVAAGGGQILKFTPSGVESIFATGLDFPIDLAFDGTGNLFVADYGASYGSGNICKFTPDGARTTFASLNEPEGLAFDAAGNLFVGETGTGRIYKFAPSGGRTTFSSGFVGNIELTCDSAGNLFVSGSVGGNGVNVWKITPQGMRTRFATGMFAPASLDFDSAGNLFVLDLGLTEAPSAIYKFRSHGRGKLFAAGEPPDDPGLEFNYLTVQP